MARSRRRSNPFWSYSLRLYRRPGVAPACLALQDRLGLDVNLLLFCLWTAERGIALGPLAIAAAVNVSGLWSANVVVPLRAVRRFLKPLNVPGFRGRVARIELAAEKFEQTLLFGLLPPGEGLRASRDVKAATAAANLRRYIRRARLPVRPHDIRHFLAILAAAFPGSDARALRRGLG
jgi:uncharacterized protein (TIGR02444 family)